MKNKIVINKEFIIGDIAREMWGSFVEHMGRSVYGGIYEPTHPSADEEGFRGDVKEAIRALHVPIIRYPGGNFLSGYRWRDGIGQNRPVRLDLAWGQLEPNKVGLHEFCSWAEKVGSEVMMSVNMGTGTPLEAAEIVEYCNHPAGTTLSDERKKNGREAPFGIRMWCIGNEMDGDWQICRLTAEEYGRKAAETAKMMKWVDGSIKLVVCGSSGPTLSTYPEWDRIILQHTYDYADYISLHRYYTYTPSMRVEDLLSSHTDFDRFIKSVAATADYVQTYRRSKKRMMLSVDEWNVYHDVPKTAASPDVYNDGYRGRWTVGPRRAENKYELADTLAFTGLMMTLINNADRVKAGCLAQLVNVIAPVMTETGGGMFRNAIYYPYQMAIRYAKGRALDLRLVGEKMPSDYGDTEKVYAACTEEGGVYTLFLLNKTDEPMDETLDFQTADVRMTERFELSGDLHAFNDFAHPDDVVPRAMPCERGKKPQFTVRLPAYSFTLMRFEENAETQK